MSERVKNGLSMASSPVQPLSRTCAQAEAQATERAPRRHQPTPWVGPTRWALWMVVLLVLSVLVGFFCLRFGTKAISFSELVPLVIPGLRSVWETNTVDPITSTIVWQVRVPRIVLAFLVGGSLATVGGALQALLRNPLADPYVIGVSSGAALGAAVAILFGVGGSIGGLSTLPLCAFVGALGSLAIVYVLASRHSGLSMYTLLLAGVVLNAILSAVIMFLTSIAEPSRAFGMYAWLMGNLTGPDPATLGTLTVYVAIGIGMMVAQARALNLLALGEEVARSLGVDVERVKKGIFVSAALLTGAVVAFSGMIGFVGLIVPHMIRLAVSADHRLLLPASCFVGGMFLMVADTVARTVVSPGEIPVGVITAIVGGPIFLYLLVQRSRRSAL
ncbi:MAG: iron ABC transporter permease [Nitrospirae bacterium]|nr:MAG: iron ABC transporter permease [Nitrospirota bacterium]